MKNLISSLELQIEIEELKELGLTADEILGYIDFFDEELFDFDDKDVN